MNSSLIRVEISNKLNEHKFFQSSFGPLCASKHEKNVSQLTRISCTYFFHIFFPEDIHCSRNLSKSGTRTAYRSCENSFVFRK